MTTTTLTFASRRVQVIQSGGRFEETTTPGNASGFAIAAGYSSTHSKTQGALLLFDVPGDMLEGTITAATLDLEFYADTSGLDEYRVKIGVPANLIDFSSQSIDSLATGSNKRYIATNGYAAAAGGSPQIDATYPNDSSNPTDSFDMLAAINEAQAAGRLSNGQLQILIAVNDIAYTPADEYQMVFSAVSLEVTYTPASLWITASKTIRVGQTNTLTLNRPGTSGALVADISQSTSGVLTIPSTVTIANGNSSQTFDVTGANDGLTILTADDGTNTADTSIEVVDMTDRLVSLWHMDEASGDELDAWGSNDPTAHNSPGSTTGKLDDCRTLASSSSQYFSHASNSALQAGDIDFTLACWVYLSSLPANTGAYSIMSKDTDTPSSSRDYTLDYLRNDSSPTGAGFRFYINGGGSVGTIVRSGTSGFNTTGQWYHVVAWHDATANTLNIEVNGILASVSTSGTAPQVSDAEFRIGSRAFSGFNDFLNGRIDEAALFKGKLTTTERAYLFNGGDGNLVTDATPPPPAPSNIAIIGHHRRMLEQPCF